MSELKNEVKIYIMEYTCDECEKKPNPGCILKKVKSNELYFTYPSYYKYECPNCKKEFPLNEIYPYLKHEKIQDIY
jgi:predicted nucleotidyltransferase